MSGWHPRGGRLVGAGLAVLAVVIGGILLAGSSATGAAALDPPAKVEPVFPKVEFTPAKLGEPCYAKTVLREAAAEKVRLARVALAREARLRATGTGSETDYLDAELLVRTMQAALVEARYAEAACYLGLTNGGKGDSCKALALEYNRLVALLAEQEGVLSVKKAVLAMRKKEVAAGAGAPARVDAAELDVVDADTAVKLTKDKLAVTEKALKADCPATDYKRPDGGGEAGGDDGDETAPTDGTAPTDEPTSPEPTGPTLTPPPTGSAPGSPGTYAPSPTRGTATSTSTVDPSF